MVRFLISVISKKCLNMFHKIGDHLLVHGYRIRVVFDGGHRIFIKLKFSRMSTSRFGGLEAALSKTRMACRCNSLTTSYCLTVIQRANQTTQKNSLVTYAFGVVFSQPLVSLLKSYAY